MSNVAHIDTPRIDGNALVQSLVSKAISFLNKEFIPPTAAELRALRKELKLTKEVASKRISISLRTWASRESRDNQSHVREEEFAMIILFMLRGTRFWEQIQCTFTTADIHQSGFVEQQHCLREQLTIAA